MRKPENRQLNLDMDLRKLTEQVTALSVDVASFIRSEAGRAHLPFWSRRAAFPDDLPLEPGAPRDRIARRIVVEDGKLVEAEVLITPHLPGGVAWVEGQPAAAVWRALEAGASREQIALRFGRGGEIVAAWAAAAAPARG